MAYHPPTSAAHSQNGIKAYLVSVGATLTVALVMQSLALVWWASRIDTKVYYLERDLGAVSTRVTQLESGNRERGDFVATNPKSPS